MGNYCDCTSEGGAVVIGNVENFDRFLCLILCKPAAGSVVDGSTSADLQS